MAEVNPYELAVMKFLARRMGKPDDAFKRIEFGIEYYGCETCGGESPVIELTYKNGHVVNVDLNNYTLTLGALIEGAVEVMNEDG